VRRDFGSIRRSGRSSWEVRYPVRGQETPGRKVVLGTLADAERMLETRRIEHMLGDRERLTVGNAWTKLYLPSYDFEHLEKSTQSGYRSCYEHHIGPAFGQRTVASVTHAQVQEWLGAMSPGAAKHAVVILRIVFNHAEYAGVVSTNIMKGARYKMPSRKTGDSRRVNVKVYAADELDAVLDAARGQSFEAALIVMGIGGLRREEAFGVRKDELRFETIDGKLWSFVPVNRAVLIVDGKMVIKGAKNEQSAREGIVKPPYSERLREIMEGMTAGAIWLQDDGSGQPRNPDKESKKHARWAAEQPFRYVTMSNFRATSATNLYGDGMDTATIAYLLGHTSDAVTRKHYIRPTKEDLVRKIDEASFGKQMPQESRDDRYDELLKRCNQLSDMLDFILKKADSQ
jgi:integrase